MTVVRLPPGFYCAECGVDVIEKVVTASEPLDRPQDYGSVRSFAGTDVGPNLPCGHHAATLWARA